MLSAQNYRFTVLSSLSQKTADDKITAVGMQNKKLQSKFGHIFCNNLYYNYSCASFHELNMSCVWDWDVMEVNDKRQPVIEVVATWA